MSYLIKSILSNTKSLEASDKFILIKETFELITVTKQ